MTHMTRMTRMALAAAALAAFALVLPTALSTQRETAQATVFVNARILDGSGSAIEGGTFVVRGGRIQDLGDPGRVTIPAGAARIDLGGHTVIPGLVNAHGHVGQALGLQTGPEINTEANVLDQLGRYGRYGITTVVSLGGDGDAGFRVRDRESPPVDHARLFVAGPVLSPSTPAEARQAVEALADRKPDFVKFRVDDNLGTGTKMPVSVYQTIIEVAQRRGLPVAAHIYYLEDAVRLVQSGVDLIAHSVRDQPVSDEFIALLRQREVCVCPTLTREVSTFVYRDRPAFFDDPFFTVEADPAVMTQLQDPARQARVRASESARAYEAGLKVASANLKTLVDAGVTIAFGTDSGPPGRFQGYFEHMELDLMAEAGLTPAQILSAATRDAARCMGLEGQVGTIEPGAWADFVVLAGNPLDDIANFHRIESVWVGGNQLDR